VGGGWRDELLNEFNRITKEQLEASASAQAWYRDHSAQWCKSAEERFAALLDLIARWKQLQEAWQQRSIADQEPPDHRTHRPRRFFASNPPLPEAMLRIHPEL
jgi:hypothetical protein